MFNNTLPSFFYWVLFHIENLRQAVEIVNRTLTKEKLHRQLTGLSTGTPPFLKIKEGNKQRQRIVEFNKVM